MLSPKKEPEVAFKIEGWISPDDLEQGLAAIRQALPNLREFGFAEARVTVTGTVSFNIEE